MFREIKPLMVVIFTMTTTFLDAQQQYNTWLRAAIGLSINQNLTSEVEFQLRRQNGFEAINPLQKQLMTSTRTWIHLKTKHNIRFSVSPFAYFYHSPIILQKTDENGLKSPEIRFTLAMETNQQLAQSWQLIQRTALEHRFATVKSRDYLRFRTKIGVQYQLSNAINIGVFDELFLNTATKQLSFFDQNRIGLQLTYKVGTQFKMEIGYLFNERATSNSVEKIREHNFLIHLNYGFKLQKNGKLNN